MLQLHSFIALSGGLFLKTLMLSEGGREVREKEKEEEVEKEEEEVEKEVEWVEEEEVVIKKKEEEETRRLSRSCHYVDLEARRGLA